MSETTGVMTAQAFPNLVQLGTCGAPISPAAVKLDTDKGARPGEDGRRHGARCDLPRDCA